MALAVEQVLEAGEAGVAGVVALGHLGELHLVADEDQVAGGLADGDRVGEGDLAGLVDERGSRTRPPAPARLNTQAVPPTRQAPPPSTPATSFDSITRTCPCCTSGSSSSSPTL